MASVNLISGYLMQHHKTNFKLIMYSGVLISLFLWGWVLVDVCFDYNI